jgi:hypothetical protein
LEFVRTTATGRQIASVRIDLNARSAPLNLPQRFYPRIAECVSLGRHLGLRAIIESAFLDEALRKRLLQFAWAPESGVLRSALRTIVLASRALNSDVLIDSPAWETVTGVDLAPFDGKRTKAIERIGSVARLLRALGGGGLVIVLDEAETIDQLWNRLSRMGAYQTLGAFCRLDAVWAVFGVTERFDRSVDDDVERGMLSYAPTVEASEFLRTWRARSYRVAASPAVDDQNAPELVRRIVDLYRSAYPGEEVDDTAAARALDGWRRNPSRNPRRLIRALIDALDESRPLPAPALS